MFGIEPGTFDNTYESFVKCIHPDDASLVEEAIKKTINENEPLDMTYDYLKEKNYTNVKSFYSGDECIQSLKSGVYPDIVLQDYYMDKLNGIDVLRKVKKLNAGTEFIFLTGNESTEVVVNSIKFGAFDYIIKNEFAFDKLGDKMAKIIRIKELEKNNNKIRNYKIAFGLVILLLVIVSSLFLL